MGTLIYGHALQLDIDDRTLEHIKHVVFAKLRKQESFPLVCTRADAEAISLWVSRDIAIGFRIEQPAELSRELVGEYMRLASTAEGLVVAAE